jgi:hypothetical protein
MEMSRKMVKVAVRQTNLARVEPRIVAARHSARCAARAHQRRARGAVNRDEREMEFDHCDAMWKRADELSARLDCVRTVRRTLLH